VTIITTVRDITVNGWEHIPQAPNEEFCGLQKMQDNETKPVLDDYRPCCNGEAG